jgi:hypothetical protein
VTSEYVDSFLHEGIELLFIAFQSQFDDPDELGFRPMEVAIMTYSLQNGIGKIYHEIMDPGPPPYGMMVIPIFFISPVTRQVFLRDEFQTGTQNRV